MRPEEAKRHVIVGIFIFLGLIILAVGIFTLGGQKKTFVKSIRISATFDDIEGLKQGNNVWFLGVKIGTIQNISFSGINDVEVIMNIEKEAQRFIHKDARAKISTDGFIGNKIIVIEGGSSKQPSVEDGDHLQVTKVQSTEVILKTLQDNNQNILSITSDLKKITRSIAEGKNTVGALLYDRALADNLKATIGNLQQTSALTSRTAGELVTFSSKLNRKGGLADQLLTDTAVFSEIRASVASLQRTTSSAAAISQNLDKASDKLNGSNTPVGVLLNDPRMAEQLKIIINNLESSSKKLDENMEALQHNFLLRGFFKRKERQNQ